MLAASIFHFGQHTIPEAREYLRARGVPEADDVVGGVTAFWPRLKPLVADTSLVLHQAIKAGRLAKSIGRTSDGKPFIADAETAAQEWKAGASRPA